LKVDRGKKNMEIKEVDLSYGHLEHLNSGLGHMLARDKKGIECERDVVGAS